MHFLLTSTLPRGRCPHPWQTEPRVWEERVGSSDQLWKDTKGRKYPWNNVLSMFDLPSVLVISNSWPRDHIGLWWNPDFNSGLKRKWHSTSRPTSTHTFWVIIYHAPTEDQEQWDRLAQSPSFAQRPYLFLKRQDGRRNIEIYMVSN